MLSDKKLKRISKVLGKEELEDFNSAEFSKLEDSILQAVSSIKEAEDELEANPKYQELKENLKALSAGLKEVKKRQNAIISFCSHLMEEKGGK
jgi:DNA-binding transcriptional regulator GbsR (MarR family)